MSRSVLWLGIVALALPLLGASPPERPSPAGPPTRLRCEYEASPMGLDDPSPRFSWQLNDARRGARQTAYQILVAPSVQDLQRDQGALWDTGKQDSTRSVFVAYRGAPLRSRQRCWWKVRVWDQDGRPTGWSAPATFEMGIMDASEWTARWIGLRQGADELAMGPWIWHPADQGAGATIYLRAPFVVRADAQVAEARLYATADNGATLFVNGERLGSSQDWKTLSTWDVTGKLGPGANVVAAEATNADGPAAFVAGLLIRYEDGQTQAITTADGWRTAADAAGEWTTAGHDDSAWEQPVVVTQWGAAPYGRPGQGGGGRNLRSQCFRKEFRLDQPVKSARAYASGLGLYELRINGHRVGDDELAPGWTLYDKRVQYQTFDVTDLLRAGRNAVGAVVGNGWWSGRINWRTPPPGVRNVLRFVCELDVELANGEHVLVATDDSWRAHESPVLSDDLYDGETYDARLAMPGWDQPGFDDHEWQPTAVIADEVGRLVAQRGPSIRCTHTFPPIAVTEPSPGVFVFDFGQNLAGRERLKVRGPAGTVVRIRFAEVLNPDGTIYTENYRSAQVTDTYILRGDGAETWAPRFTYRGFRYAEVTGFPGKPAADALTAEAVHSDAPVIGSFECSEPLLNQIQHNIVWGQRSNMHSVPTDCPQRDERLGWTGDAQAFAPTACWNMDMASFFAKWMADLRDSQGPGGEVADIAPVGAPSAGSPAWADVITIVPWNVFRFYGDARLVDTSFDSMRGWVEYMRRHAPNHLYEREGYGDWIAPVGTPKKPIGAAYYYLSTRRLAEMAAARGRALDAQQYSALADDIARAFNKAYLAPDGNYPGGTQTANLLPLAFGITPAERRTEVAAHIAQDVRGRKDHLSTGFLGTAFLLPVLSDMGYHDLAYRLATQRTYPSWGYMVEKGATTIWELWNSDTEGPGMNSRNHFALGGVGEWFYEYLAGVRPDADHPGFEHFTVWPRPAKGLTWTRADYESPHGRIRSAWRLDGDRLVMDVEVPANTTATINVPTADVSRIRESGRVPSPRAGLTYRGQSSGAAIFDAVAGRYHFEATWPAEGAA